MRKKKEEVVVVAARVGVVAAAVAVVPEGDWNDKLATEAPAASTSMANKLEAIAKRRASGHEGARDIASTASTSADAKVTKRASEFDAQEKVKDGNAGRLAEDKSSSGAKHVEAEVKERAKNEGKDDKSMSDAPSRRRSISLC